MSQPTETASTETASTETASTETASTETASTETASTETASRLMEGPAGQPDMLASDADRDHAAGMLSSAFAEGRLTSGEHAERVRAAYRARTLGELARLTADLPGPAGEAGRPAEPVADDAVDRCLLCALLTCCPPAGIAWLLAARRRSRPRPGERLGLARAVTVVLFAAAAAVGGGRGARHAEDR